MGFRCRQAVFILLLAVLRVCVCGFFGTAWPCSHSSLAALRVCVWVLGTVKPCSYSSFVPRASVMLSCVD